jgi:c-di-GMP-binding flagellar brake protein YcgR
MQWLKEIKGSLARISDRRRAERVRNPAILAFYCAGAEAVPHRVRDISCTGAYMYTEERWYLGTLVQITLDVDASETEGKNAAASVSSITLWAKVVRHGEEGVGLDFVLIQRKRRESMLRFVARLKSRTV